MDSELKKYNLFLICQRMKLRCDKKNDKCEDIIEVKRGDRLMKLDKTKINEFLSEQNTSYFENEQNIEKQGKIDYNTFDYDENFKKMCKNAMNACSHYTKIFFVLEKISKFVSQMSPIFTIISSYKDFSNFQIIAISLAFFILIFIGVIGDWERLREKYAHLYEKFRNLHNSNSDDKYCEFYRNVQIFNSSKLSIDFYNEDETKMEKSEKMEKIEKTFHI